MAACTHLTHGSMHTPHAWQPAGWGSALWQCECDVRAWTLSPHTEARERLHVAHRLTGVQATWQQEHCCSCSRTSCILHKVILQQKGIVLSGKLCLPAPTGDCITKHSAQRMSDLQNTSTCRQAWYTSRDAGEMCGRDAGVEMQGLRCRGESMGDCIPHLLRATPWPWLH
jgi:hypothetical protein